MPVEQQRVLNQQHNGCRKSNQKGKETGTDTAHGGMCIITRYLNSQVTSDYPWYTVKSFSFCMVISKDIQEAHVHYLYMTLYDFDVHK